jgi:REP element-mobilizing transposase RayT
MVAGYHLIWTVYGYWLPNDPRGSTSREIRVELLQQGCATVKHPVLTFDDDEIAMVGKTIGEVVAERGYTCYACAVMPDHVHLLIRRHRDKAEQMIEHFQAATRATLIDAGKRSPTHPVWTAGPGWKTFINTRSDFEREIEYIRQNPVKIGRPEQTWEFVQPYKGWMPAYRG